MDQQKRLIGIDLFRGLAIFAVVILHIDEEIPIHPNFWSQITDFSLFAVPFFLAVSFYLAISKLYSSRNPYPLRSRLTRILVPYSFWSAFYLLYKVAKYAYVGESSKLLNLLNDPLSLIFFGGTSFHLYFLPLLAIGMLLVKSSEVLIKRNISLKGLCLISLASFLSYEILLMTGNEYQIGINIAFQNFLASVFPTGNSNPILRFVLIVIACIIRTLPYVLVSMLLSHPSSTEFRLKFMNGYPFIWLFVFLISNKFGSQILPQSLHEIIRGYSALLTAISFQSILKENYLIKNLGLCSFGIYLIHLFIVEIFQSIVKRVYPNYINQANTIMLIVASILVLLISWSITLLIMRNKKLSGILFGQ